MLEDCSSALSRTRAMEAMAFSPMKEHKGQNAFNWRLFLGFRCVLTGCFADRLNLSLRWTALFASCGLEPFSNS
jgi:hypothetical protein